MNRVSFNCTVCDANKYKILFSPVVIEDDPVKLYGASSGIPGTQYIVQCLNCEMIYENPRFDAETVVKGYMNSNDEDHDSQFHMRIHSFYLALKKHKKLLPKKGAKVLDIGTAGGAFLDAAIKFGYDAYGMEPSQDLTNRGKARGLRIEQGTIESHNFQNESFDLICLWDVIEHLPDPKASLLEIKKLLKKDGILLINYPDIGTTQAKIAGKRFWWLISVHLHHFSRKSISNICDKTGFEVFHLQRYWQTLEFGYLEGMAAHYKVPFAALIKKMTPQFIQKIPVPYYASQTTALVRIKK